MGVYARTVKDRTGVHHATKCLRCRKTAAVVSREQPVPTGINHPEYHQTRSFYDYGPKGHACPRCHKEMELESLFAIMDRRDEERKK